MTAHEDRAQISDVLVRYATGIDSRDWPLFRTVFTEDCELDYGEIGTFVGADTVVQFMADTHQMAGHTLHRITNQAVDVDGDTATARAYVDALIMAPDNASGVNAVGFYDDELSRTDTGWRIRRRRFTVVLMRLVGSG
ncbi:nuclear transport factor 2 family protein [Mycobacterium sp. ITM-2016-00317]|uniref:nuclear transport factor 2 family protein n=1 Tax=Mycobacterium sp. ITM-2016-00317 TaxID=2099694 RepID=UPI00287FBD03|nr:nuclear transport factor 2 family protein [Mycobacterium sp. ITM-2016-00317]WNG90395.1 nuclear transport factor 2 family protein [Mycobacterium sp. ITM-2016-00317]